MKDLGTYDIYALSDRAAVIDFGNTISETVNNSILALFEHLKRQPFTGLKDMVPAYSSLTVIYDPFLIYNKHKPGSTVFSLVKEWLKNSLTSPNYAEPAINTISIPACYDAELGTDIKLVAAAKNIPVDELIHIHSSTSYRVYMLGFLPGFAYMGKLDERLVMPRRSVPRERVEAGSIGIAGWQTGIYPLSSPGGWQIIGRTPLKLFDALEDPPAMLSAGDTVQFYPISIEEFREHVANHY